MQEQRVLFLHGIMGSALNWGPTRTKLELKAARKRPLKTFAIDLLGHALNHLKKYKGSAHENLVLDLEKHVEAIKPTHVVAHSFGLRPALILGKRRPDLIPQIIVEDASPLISESAYKFLMDVIKSPVPFRTRESAKGYFDTKFGTQSVLSRFFMSNIRNLPDGKADWRFDTPFLTSLLDEALAHNLWDEWKKYPGKLHLVYGAKSEAMTTELIQKMKMLRPELPAYRIEKAGHWIHSDQPDSFVELLIELLDEEF